MARTHPTSNTSGSVAVLGAGVSGLAAAYRLRKEGVSVTVFEAEGSVGGKLRSESADGYIWDLGPNSMLENAPEVSYMIDDLQLRGKQQFPVLQNKRYILLDGSPVLLPSNLLELLTSKVLSTKSKLRMVLEPLLWKRRAHIQDLHIDDPHESVGDFLGRHVGSEVVSNLVDPFIAGTTGSDPSSLSARYTFPDLWTLDQTHGSLIMGAIRSNLRKGISKQGKKTKTSSNPSIASPEPGRKQKGSFSFVGGLQTIAAALAESIGGDNIHLNTAVVALARGKQQDKRNSGDEWTVSFSQKGSLEQKVQQRHFDAVITTLPLHDLHSVQFSKDGQHFSLDFMPKVTYQPMSVLITAFRKEDVSRPLQGFGVLIPSKEQANGFQTLGTLFSSSMFPDRVPSDQEVMFTTFIGGSRNRELAAAPFEKLKEVALKDLQRIVGVTADPLAVKHFYWERAFPQYGLNYRCVMDSLENLESSFPGLFYAGNHRDGLAVGKAMLSGYKAAGKVLEKLEAHPHSSITPIV